MVRGALDTLIADYPVMKKYLGANADIVHDKHFENAVVNVQRGDEKSLTHLEKMPFYASKSMLPLPQLPTTIKSLT